MKAKKVLYALLKEIKEGNKVTAELLSVTDEEFATVVEYAKDKNYIKNALVLRGGQGNKVLTIAVDDANITFEGKVFLDENSILSKGYKGLKEIREWLPL